MREMDKLLHKIRAMFSPDGRRELLGSCLHNSRLQTVCVTGDTVFEDANVVVLHVTTSSSQTPSSQTPPSSAYPSLTDRSLCFASSSQTPPSSASSDEAFVSQTATPTVVGNHPLSSSTETIRSSLTIRNCPRLETITCYQTDVEAIRLRNLPSLRCFRCGGNARLETVDFDEVDDLEELHCFFNERLRPIDFVMVPGVVKAVCDHNPLWDEVTLHNNSFLRHLDVRGCNLRHLDTTENRFLKTLRYDDNPLETPPLASSRHLRDCNSLCFASSSKTSKTPPAKTPTPLAQSSLQTPPLASASSSPKHAANTPTPLVQPSSASLPRYINHKQTSPLDARN